MDTSHCLICNSRTGATIRNSVQIFGPQNKLPTSEKPLPAALAEILGKNISPSNSHSSTLCKKCYKLVYEYDDLFYRVNEIEQEIVSQFKVTLSKFQISFETYPDRISTDFKQENDAKDTLSTLPNVTEMSESDSKNAVKKIPTLPKKLTPLPANVVIINHLGKKIAIQKTTKPPVILQPFKKVEATVPKEIIKEENTSEDMLIAMNPPKAEKISDTMEIFSIVKSHSEDESDLLQETIQTIENIEDCTTDMNDIKEDNAEQIFTVSSLEIINEDEMNVEECESTVLTEQIENVTLPVLQHKELLKYENGSLYHEENNKNLVKAVGKQYKCLLCEQTKKTDEENCDEEADEDSNHQTGEDNSENLLDGRSMHQHMKSVHNTRLYMCDICEAIFRRRFQLSQHLDNHLEHEGGEVGCETCVMKFSSLNELKLHRRLQHPSHKQHTCRLCNKTFGSKNLLEEHNNIHLGVKPYACNQCSKNFASKYTYQSHLKTHTDRPRPYTCSQCGKSFFTLQNLTQHEKTHLGIKEFICNICSKPFSTQHNLEVHGVVHTGHKPYECRICNKAFARRAEIRDHERIHTGERPYSCNLCGSSFSQRSNLQSHKRATHYDDKRYKCHICDKSFKRRRLLEYHIKASHTGERPFRCEICDATFVYPEHYKKHQRIHTGEKPFKCEVCGKAFNSRDNRNAHRFVHSDKKPYECLDCGAGFMRKPLLYSHMHSYGHLSDTIVVNQPRLNNTVESNPGCTFILENGQEVIITDIKHEMAEAAASTLQEDHVESVDSEMFGGDGIEVVDETGQMIIQEAVDNQENVDDLPDDKFLEGDETILTTDEDLQNLIIDGENNSQIIETEDGSTIRLVQIRLSNGEKGWVTLN